MNNVNKHFYFQATMLSVINVAGWCLIIYTRSLLFALGIVLVLLSFSIFLFLLIKKTKKEKQKLTKQSILEKNIKKNNILILIYLIILLGCLPLFYFEYFIKHSIEFWKIIYVSPLILLIVSWFFQNKQLNKQRNIIQNDKLKD